MSKRWIQFGSAVVAMIMIANLQYSWTLFVRPIQDANHWKLSDIQEAFALFLFFETWITPVEGWLIDRLGPRLFLSVGGILVGIGWTGLGFIHSLNQLYVLYSVAGVGAAFVYSGSIATALKWFPDKRGTVSGFITAGFGAGAALFIPFIAHLIRTTNYQTAFVYTGITQGIAIFVAAQCLKNPGPEFTSKAARKEPSPRIRRTKKQLNSLQMLSTPLFYLLYATFVLISVGGLMLTAQSALVADSFKISAAALTAAVAASRLANGGGRIFWGWLSDYTGREMAMLVPFALQAVSLLLMLNVGRVSGLWFTISLCAVFFIWGSMFSLFPAIIGDYFGADHATSNYGFLYTAKGVATWGGAWIAARVFEKSGSWDSVFYGSAALALISCILVLIVRVMPLPGVGADEPRMVAASAEVEIG
ncbi:MAG TPA: oxalate/formate MFS antiporter [Candidatus Angelobacter sp.]|nr:oxalate/formate MFS antiporter [Candidatus Angelobacter sp.]